MRRRSTWVEIVASHLAVRGHISEGSALIEYGRFRLGDAIYRLRNEKAHLLPEGMEIVTIHKQDTQGNRYGEYHLVPQGTQRTANQIIQARSEAAEAAAL
ncbi:hypothetical protein [Sphingopyxis flava]|uniref:hypothetical protein n=1 Tax=Sphingopyxis flava TaxID=1507287 RepID=UPI0009A56E02|nr:hypothetical protein [Sphingopyxis flava]